MSGDTFYIFTPAEHLSALSVWEARCVHPVFLLSRTGELQRPGRTPPPRGGLAAVLDLPDSAPPRPEPFSRALLRECEQNGRQGVLLDLEGRTPSLGWAIEGLARHLEGRHLPLFLPEYYAHAAPSARVLISSALSGGRLERRLEQVLDRFGAERAVLALEPSAEDFTLPAPTGCGVPLSPARLEELMARLRPCVFFSRDLCARYFTYRDGQGGVHFVLFDDTDTLCRKVELARQVGLRRFFLPWQEVCAAPERFGLRPRFPSGCRRKNFS